MDLRKVNIIIIDNPYPNLSRCYDKITAVPPSQHLALLIYSCASISTPGIADLQPLNLSPQ